MMLSLSFSFGFAVQRVSERSEPSELARPISFLHPARQSGGFGTAGPFHPGTHRHTPLSRVSHEAWIRRHRLGHLPAVKRVTSQMERALLRDGWLRHAHRSWGTFGDDFGARPGNSKPPI